MDRIHTPEDLQPFAGFLQRPENEGFTTYGCVKTGWASNQFPAQRIQLA